eukprot:1036227-Rhodomonas_salina.1
MFSSECRFTTPEFSNCGWTRQTSHHKHSSIAINVCLTGSATREPVSPRDRCLSEVLESRAGYSPSVDCRRQRWQRKLVLWAVHVRPEDLSTLIWTMALF